MRDLKTWDKWLRLDEEEFNFDGEIYITTGLEPFTFIFCFDNSLHLPIKTIGVGGIHNAVLKPESVRKEDWRTLQEAVRAITIKSRIMGEKNRLHELYLADGRPITGFKAGLAIDPGMDFAGDLRIEAWKAFGYCLNHFGGRAYSGADVNTDTFDLMITRSVSPFIVGNPPNYGGGGNPSPYTANGVYWVQRAFLSWKYGINSVEGVKFAIPGAGGKVGFPLLNRLYEEGADLVVSEIVKEREEKIKAFYPRSRVQIQHPDLIRFEPCVIYAPCDSGVTVIPETVGDFQCEAMIGAQNAQTQAETPEEIDELENRLLYKKGIFHPDPSGAFPNGGGVIEVVDELLPGGFNKERVDGKIEGFYGRTIWLLEESQKQDKPPYLILRDWLEEQKEKIRNKWK